MTVCLHVVDDAPLKTVNCKSKLPALLPGLTETVWFVFDPLMVAPDVLLASAHEYVKPAGAEKVDEPPVHIVLGPVTRHGIVPTGSDSLTSLIGLVITALFAFDPIEAECDLCPKVTLELSANNRNAVR